MRRADSSACVSSDGMQGRDITQEFTGAASALRTGQLVKEEHFTLFEAVGALEIMDAKMDSGYLASGETLDDDYDIFRKLLPEEVVGIMDQLLCHEVAWHMGHPLSQTLFTSIYLDRLLWPVPNSLEDTRFDRQTRQNSSRSKTASAKSNEREKEVPKLVSIVLRAYCLALIRACDLVHVQVSSEYFNEEEDFITQLYNRKLLSDVDTERVQAVLNEALSWLQQQDDIAKDVKAALLDRLSFRGEFLGTLDLDTGVIGSRSTQSVRESLRLIELVDKSAELGQPVEEAFSLKIQRRLASTVPPRPMVKIKHEDATKHMTRFCRDLMDAEKILNYRGPHNLRVALWSLQSRKPQPAPYTRSLCQSLLLHDMRVLGCLSVKQFIFDELASLVLPNSQILDSTNEGVEAPSDFRFWLSKQMDNFVTRMAQPFLDTYRTSCMNRSRIRRTLCHTALDWDTLQAEAEDFDVQIRALTLEPPIKLHGDEPTYSYPLSSWTYHQKLRQLRLIIQLGFELSIYAPEELPGMYWYLSHICSTHLAHLDRIRACVTAAFQKMSPASRTQVNRKPEVDASRRRAFNQTFALLGRLTTELIWIDAFSIALNCLYILLERHSILPSRSLPGDQRYSSENLRYELRMKPFLPITLPESIPFELFKREATMEGEKDEAVLERAQRAIDEARKALEKYLADGPYLPFEGSNPHHGESRASDGASPGLESDWVKDVKDSLRACIGTSITIGTVKKAMSTASCSKWNLSVEIPEIGAKGRWHDWWAVPQISEILPLHGGPSASAK